ncbi:DUF2199 domain-containing protein [Burkholderia sp. BCC1977]|uniref:DUF2199 domain-containing protein n=1 Tax=Burkholderia sp. BCC1977 TaxID=2817440 RepID=UPI002ABD1D0A|nr:DUF2199 domain-containing protein [Burkholderia sp. BCC1977]
MATFRFQCAQCDEWHEGEPSVAFKLPDFLLGIPEPERATRAIRDEDMCVVDRQYFFVRACLEVPIIGADEPFLWGLWVSLSERSFDDYLENQEAGNASGPYFSWLANRLPGYPVPKGLKSHTHPRLDGQRPLVELDTTDHPLSLDFHNGMSAERAQTLFEKVLHQDGSAH